MTRCLCFFSLFEAHGFAGFEGFNFGGDGADGFCGVEAGGDGDGLLFLEAVDEIFEFVEVAAEVGDVSGDGAGGGDGGLLEGDVLGFFGAFDEAQCGAFAEVEFEDGFFEDGLVAHVEAELCGVVPTALGGDGDVFKVVGGEDVGPAGVVFGADACDGGGLTEEVEDVVGIVDVEVGYGAAAALGVLQPVAFAVHGAAGAAGEAEAEELAVFAGFFGLFEVLVFGPEADAVADHEGDFFALGGLVELKAFGSGGGEGFFAEDVFAGGDGFEADGYVHVGGEADVDDVDVWPGGEKLFEGGVYGDVEPELLLLGDGVVGVGVYDGDELGLPDGLVAFTVHLAHGAESDYCDFLHVFPVRGDVLLVGLTGAGGVISTGKYGGGWGAAGEL